MGVEHHLLRLARIGAHEQHAAVAEADLSHLHHVRHAVEHDHLVAPVELEGLARREGERNVGLGGSRTLLPLPGARVAAHGIVAAGIASHPQLLEHAHERQPLARRLADVGCQQFLERRHAGAELRQRLLLARVAMHRLTAAHDAPHRVARDPQLPRDRLDPLALYVELPPNPSDRLHRKHPRSPSSATRARTRAFCTKRGGVRIARRSPRKRGQNCTPVHTCSPAAAAPMRI